jgi:hypothetical protein
MTIWLDDLAPGRRFAEAFDPQPFFLDAVAIRFSRGWRPAAGRPRR